MAPPERPVPPVIHQAHLAGLELAFGVAFVGILIWLARYDFKHYRLPDPAVLALAGLGLLRGLILPSVELPQALLSAAIAFSVLWVLREAYFRWRGIEGLGLGDAKLAGAGGLWINATDVGPMLVIAATTALLIVGFRRILPYWPQHIRDRVAFGPALAVSLIGLWFAGTMH